MSSNEIETIIRSYNKEKSRTGWIHCKFCKTFNGELISVLLRLFNKIEKEGTHSMKPVLHGYQSQIRTHTQKRK
jgi:hypothetical protein